MSDDIDNEIERSFDEADDDAGFDDFAGQDALKDLWRNNPFVKIGAIFGVLAIIVGALTLFGDKGVDTGPVSMVNSGSDVSQTPGDDVVSDTYRRAVEEENMARVEEAIRKNSSAIPVPLDPPKGDLSLADESEGDLDPLERWRRLQEERRNQVVIPSYNSKSNKAASEAQSAAISTNAEKMMEHMVSVLEAKELSEEIPSFDVTGIEWLEGLESEAAVAREEAAAEAAANAAVEKDILITPGSILYAQLLLEANTDAPGPVMAQLVTGPYAGSRILGQFSATDNYLTLSFSTLVIDGIGYDINAIALDPETSLPGLVSDIDHRYVKRVVLPAAAAFITGLAEAISESGQTNITVTSTTTTSETDSDQDSDQEVASGISEAGEKIGEILDDEAGATEIMIKVDAGTAIGVLFVEPVIADKVK